ncbi:MAG: hypothetical protein KJ614_15040 [Gammaproteobacteria bacterium]|nr:hypothetical protein [Gammaproteobacteria bacterium]MBU3999537.1 hypothetical protein [Gammaproteobacteria bacterium]MBU4082277.1 hypothetical protein [Gammaproteobacteria bacterium]MBU4171839.1 hypothetical protein [Gammaproteobacteria bacterium]
MHFHVCVVDGVFEALAHAQSDSEAPDSANAPAVTFHPAQIDEAAIATVQAKVRKRLASAPLWHAATCMRMTPKTWLATPTVADFLSTPGCALRQQTALGCSACCATVRGHFLPWTGSNSAALTWCTAAAKGMQSHCNPTNTPVNWCITPWS